MKNILTLICFIFTGFVNSQTPPASEPLFTNSIVSTDIDFIKSSDPDAFVSLTYIGQFLKEMPDSESEVLFDSDAYVFEADFSDGNMVEIWCHSSFGSETAAQEYADKLTPRLGKLPDFMRAGLHHIVIHNGDAGAFSDAEFFILYSDNMDVRISNNDLEETVFHESVHATLDALHSASTAWINAQTSDVNFITDYAESYSTREDLAETTIFAYTMLKYPGRLSASIENWVNIHIPYRLGYIRDNIFPEFIGLNEFDQPRTSLTVYPNPASTEINVFVKNVKQNTPLHIYNISGELVRSIDIKKEQNVIFIKDLSKGIYYIKTEGYQATKLIIL